MSFWEPEPLVEHAITAIIKHLHENWYMQWTVNDSKNRLSWLLRPYRSTSQLAFLVNDKMTCNASSGKHNGTSLCRLLPAKRQGCYCKSVIKLCSSGSSSHEVPHRQLQPSIYLHHPANCLLPGTDSEDQLQEYKRKRSISFPSA